MGLNIAPSVDLRRLNTFAISERAEWLVEVSSDNELRAALVHATEQNQPVTILGGGSNWVLSGPVPGLTIAMRSRGRRVLERDKNHVIVEGEAGESWHQLVCWSLDLGLHGLENLSLIPGTLGAAPMQNIGAYGVELCDVFDSLEAFDRKLGNTRWFSGDDCQFAYRDSLFKREAGRYVILRVRLRLSRQPQPKLGYAPLADAWDKTGLTNADSRVISELVCRIRRSKLPDPEILGNAGSFFKNPLVDQKKAQELLRHWPQMPHYRQPGNLIKLAAGWLIDQAGWKGYRRNNVGVHQQQALVLVNYGGARGAEIMALAQDISEDIFNRFGVILEMEPQVIGNQYRA